MNEFTTIKNMILDLGAELLSEDSHPDDFGSALATFCAGNASRFRLVWDGKDGCAFLQTENENGQWQDVSPAVGEGFRLDSPALINLIGVAKSLVQRCAGG